MNFKINVVIVTYNRRTLLEECLTSVTNQSYVANKIIIINNNSTDSTKEYLDSLKDDNLFRILNLDKNIGGAGGFSLGLKESYLMGADWTWVMDDDTIPTPDALEKLVNKIDKIPNLGFLSSKVLWTNDDVHIMNVTCPEYLINGIPFNQYSNHQLFLIPNGSFVSMLVNNNVIKKIGLPIKEIFIWGDDVEFSRRIVKHGYLGAYVNDSIVYHKTLENYNSDITHASLSMRWKYFYSIRNGIYLKKTSNNGITSSLKILKLFYTQFSMILKRTENKYSFFKVLINGFFAGIVFSPKIEKITEKKETTS